MLWTPHQELGACPCANPSFIAQEVTPGPLLYLRSPHPSSMSLYLHLCVLFQLFLFHKRLWLPTACKRKHTPSALTHSTAVDVLLSISQVHPASLFGHVWAPFKCWPTNICGQHMPGGVWVGQINLVSNSVLLLMYSTVILNTADVWAIFTYKMEVMYATTWVFFFWGGVRIYKLS